MIDHRADRFTEYLQRAQYLRQVSPLPASDGSAAPDGGARLWETTSLTPAEFADEAARFYRLRRVGLPDLLSATSLAESFSQRFLREMLVYPCRGADGARMLALVDPGETAAAQAAALVLGPDIELVVATSEDISTVLDQRIASEEQAAPDGADAGAFAEDDIESLRDLASGAPVVRAVNDIMEKAVEMRASDIHFEPARSGLAIRYRIDGLLRVMPAPVGVVPQALISRIKIVAGLNIAERRLPQDGAARLRLGRNDIDIRVAIMPTQYGESAVIRLLPKDRGLLAVDKLGFLPKDEAILRRMLALPHGMIIICGPTGSGKTTTLATVLSILNEPTRKILTIEDPVEYEIPGINQSQVKAGIGLTFAAALRSFVRQDPDVIMLGEVRDAETAHTAVHAALTGHLVLTTLHTENAAATVPRLIDMGVEAFLLRSTLRAVIAQRLVRKLCDRCKRSRILTADDLERDPRIAELGLAPGDTLCEPVGCERCGGTGYRGRIGVFEILEMTSGLRPLVHDQVDSSTIDEAAIRAGMTTMLDDGAAKCRAGATSISEIFRVTTLR